MAKVDIGDVKAGDQFVDSKGTLHWEALDDARVIDDDTIEIHVRHYPDHGTSYRRFQARSNIEIVRTFYVTVPAHVTFYKYEVKADSLEEAKAKYAENGDMDDDVEYVGYIDGDWTNGPAEEWSDESYVEGHG